MANHGLSSGYHSKSGMGLVILFVFGSMDLVVEEAVTDQRLREPPNDGEESSNPLAHNHPCMGFEPANPRRVIRGAVASVFLTLSPLSHTAAPHSGKTYGTLSLLPRFLYSMNLDLETDISKLNIVLLFNQ